jgi:hypothetical protein
MKRLLAATVITVIAGAGLRGWCCGTECGAAGKSRCRYPRCREAWCEQPGAPVAGANSFTKAEALSRIEKAGYTNVSGLAKDKDGIWRGKANNGSAMVPVALDYQGNVVPK